jgi:hypothetical protein
MRGISRAIFVVAISTAGGCAQVPPPSYQAPTGQEARLAYADALRASLEKPGDVDEGPPPGREETYLEAMARGGRISRAKHAIGNNEVVLKSIASLSRAEPGACTWTALDLDDATGDSDVDPASYPAFAWHCSVRIVHETAARGRVEASTEGYFFREGAKFVYVGKAAHGFKRSIDIERGLV